MEEAREGITAAQESLRLYEELGDKQGEACALITMSMCYAFMRKHEAAQLFAEKGKALCEEIGDFRNKGAADGVLGLLESGGMGEGQTRRAAFFAQHPDRPYAKQCMELSLRLRGMSETSATG